jgi:hypothetical protein
MEPFQVVCIDRTCELSRLYFGEIYTVIKTEASQLGKPGEDFLYLSRDGSSRRAGPYWRSRFKPIEEMQNTNFIQVANK